MLCIVLNHKVLGKHIFKKWVNPLSLYVVIWYFLISFYHIKLISYIDLSYTTWFVITITYLSFLFGIITFFMAKESFGKKNILSEQNSFDNNEPVLFRKSAVSAYLTLGFGVLGLLGALQAWSVVLSIYGNVVNALLNLGALYQMRVHGELKGIIPYTTGFLYISIFFAGINSGVKGRITLISVLPLAALIIKEVAEVGRAGILFGFAEYGFAFLLILYKKKKKKKGFNYKLAISVLLAISLFIASVTFIKNLRGTTDLFTGKTRSMKKLENSVFLTPSVYLYLSGHIGVLNKFLEKNDEEKRFGESTFQFVYNILSKFDLVKKPEIYQKGYYIPIWMNTGTFIRELLADFGVSGLLLFMYFLGIFISLAWHNYFSGDNITYLIILVFLSLIIFFFFLFIITRMANWYLSFLSIFIICKIIQKFESPSKNLVLRYNGK